MAELTSTYGAFNYLDTHVEPSLYRNGKVLTRRDLDGSDAGTEGVDLAAQRLEVANARALAVPPTLKLHGFELCDAPLADASMDFHDHLEVARHYYPECEEIVSAATGAHHEMVFAFDHNLRSAAGKQNRERIVGGQQVQGPAHVVHGDYTLTSAPQRLRDLTKPAGRNDTLRAVLGPDEGLIEARTVADILEDGGRFAIVNVWRSIVPEPVETNPLGLCDARTVAPEDLVVFEIHYADRIGENYFAKHSDRHRWHYFDRMQRDEALLIKQWDSAGTLSQSCGARGDGGGEDPSTFSFHSAFEDEATRDDAPDRRSIEVRCIVLYDD